MTRIHTGLVFVGSCLLGLVGPAMVTAQTGPLVYADFEKMENGRPVSARGGLIEIVAYQESDLHKSTFKGLDGATPPAPEWVRLKPDDPNHAVKFDFALQAPNQYAGVGIEIHGQPDKDGKSVADDVSGYKELTLQVYATGVTVMRVEAISRGQGIDFPSGYPQKVFKVQPGLNVYKVPINTLQQPSWVETRGDPKAILKKLTALNITAFCDACTPVKGMVVVDNVVFGNGGKAPTSATPQEQGVR
jgi:hypothetical protein